MPTWAPGTTTRATLPSLTDLGLLTARHDLCDDDVVTLFNALTGHAETPVYNRLLVARSTSAPPSPPSSTARSRTPGRGGPRIIAKMNSLEDKKTAERLYAASAPEVPVELYVRGFCCVRAGVPGLSERITVTSIIGRFLEHARIYHFAAGRDDPLDGEFYIGSADWMYRNLNDRVEAVSPVDDPEARRRIMDIFEVHRADRRNAWDLTPDGTYRQRTLPAGADPDSPEALGTFETLMRASA